MRPRGDDFELRELDLLCRRPKKSAARVSQAFVFAGKEPKLRLEHTPAKAIERLGMVSIRT